MKKNAIVTGGTKDQFPAMAVLALNIADICPNIADVLVIYHDGIPLKEQNKIQKIFPTRFIEYKSPFLDVNNFDDVVTKYFSTMIFCKYECFKLLEEYQTVIWTDYDVVILKDISNLKNKHITACFMPDTHIKSLTAMFYPTIEEEKLSNTFLDKIGICTPLFILHDSLKNCSEIYRDCILMTIKYAKHLYLPEQCIFNMIIENYKIDYFPIPYIPYATHPVNNDINDSTKIIHAYGQPKFWNGQHNNQWEKYYKIWITKYHGSEIQCRIDKKILSRIKNILKKIIKCMLPYGFIRLIQIKKEQK